MSENNVIIVQRPKNTYPLSVRNRPHILYIYKGVSILVVTKVWTNMSHVTKTLSRRFVYKKKSNNPTITAHQIFGQVCGVAEYIESESP